MDDNARLLKRAVSTSSACLLPLLRDDIDSKPIGRQDFNEFLMILDDQFHLLLDILYQNGNLLRDSSIDDNLTQLRVNLLLLRCEQAAGNQFFQTEQKILIDSLVSLTDNNFQHFDDKVFLKVIETYKAFLTKNCWKRQLGMIHGISMFSEILFSKKAQLVDSDLLMFLLSVGSNLASHHDPYFKTLGLRIYNQMLKLGDKKLMKDLNISQVISNECFSMLRKSSDTSFNEELYDSLFHVILIEESDTRNSKWSKFDDVMSELSTQFGVENNPSTSEVLLQKIIKFCAIDYEKFETKSDNLSKFKTSQVNHRALRWLKKLMETMTRESPRMNNSDDCLKIVRAFHCIYITTIQTLPSEVLGKQLIDFTKKFVVLLLQASTKFREDSKVTASVISFLKTFENHQLENVELVDCLFKARSEIKMD